MAQVAGAEQQVEGDVVSLEDAQTSQDVFADDPVVVRLVVGDVANSIPCGNPPQWELKQLSSGSGAVEATTDGSGSLWLFVGTDSGFEATTSVYYTWVTATFEPL